LRDIAGEMGVCAAGLFDAARQQFRGPVGAGYADIASARAKVPGDIGARPSAAPVSSSAPGERDGHQIQRVTLAMIAMRQPAACRINVRHMEAPTE
jgi:hypothetical protein